MKAKAKRNFLGGVLDGKRVTFKQGQIYDLSKYPSEFIGKIKNCFEVKKEQSIPEKKIRGKKKAETTT